MTTSHEPLTDAKAKNLAEACERVRIQPDSQENLVAKIWTEHCSHLLTDRTTSLKIIKGLYISLLHAPPPEKAHEGSCHPDAGCDGLCAAAYSYDMLLDEARRHLAAVKEK